MSKYTPGIVGGGGGGTVSPLTDKGDLYTFDTDNVRLPVGADGQTIEPERVGGSGTVGYVEHQVGGWNDPYIR